MALSGHRTPQAARLYVNRTEQQRSCKAPSMGGTERNERKSVNGWWLGEWKWNR